MAHPEDVAALLSGRVLWQEYSRQRRASDPSWTANLTGADLTWADLIRTDLTGAGLTRADLTGAHLFEARLIRAKLTGAKLARAKLTWADLTGADLTEADLTGAYLIGADLTGADLTEADLTGAYLTRANLTRANLRGANLTEAYLIGANLTGVWEPDAVARLGGLIVDQRVSSGWVIGFSADMDPMVPVERVVQLVSAVGALAQLSVRVGPRLGDRRTGSGLAVLTGPEAGEPVRLRQLHYGSPYWMELFEQLLAVTAIGSTAPFIVRDLLKGPENSQVLKTLCTLLRPRTRELYLEGIDAKLEAETAEYRSIKAIADAKAHEALPLPPASRAELEQNVRENVDDPLAAAEIGAYLSDLEPLFSEDAGVTLTVTTSEADPGNSD